MEDRTDVRGNEISSSVNSKRLVEYYEVQRPLKDAPKMKNLNEKV